MLGQGEWRTAPSIVDTVWCISLEQPSDVVVHNICLFEDSQKSVHRALTGQIGARSHAKNVTFFLVLQCKRVHTQLALFVRQSTRCDLPTGLRRWRGQQKSLLAEYLSSILLKYCYLVVVFNPFEHPPPHTIYVKQLMYFLYSFILLFHRMLFSVSATPAIPHLRTRINFLRMSHHRVQVPHESTWLKDVNSFVILFWRVTYPWCIKCLF